MGIQVFRRRVRATADLTTFFSSSTNLNNRGRFSEGSTNTRYYDLDFQTASKFLIFNYAVVANYNWPTGSSPYSLSNFPITSANSQEAFCVKAYEISNTLWYDSTWAIGGGILNLDVEVWDWQGLGSTSVKLYLPSGTTPTVATYTSGSTSYSGIFSFPNLVINPSSANPFDITIVATDSSASFGSAWFMGLLPVSNSQYATSVYTVIKERINVATAGITTVLNRSTTL